MDLLRTSLLSALAVLTKLASSLFLNKILALYVGPAGYAVIGQFQSLVSMVTTFASGAVNIGVTKYTAEYVDDQAKQRRVWVTAAAMGFAGAMVCGCLLLLLRERVARWLLGSDTYSHILVWLSAALFLLVLNGLMLAILNGRKAVREFVAANIVGSLFSAGVATVLVVYHGLEGALLALVVSQAAACGFTAWMFHRACRIAWQQLIWRIDRSIARSLAGYAAMAATSALLVPFGQIVIRDRIAAMLGWESAGLWQAMWRISETHLLLLTSTLSVYFLPRFSEIRSGAELRREIRKGYAFVLPVALTSACILYWLRRPLIEALLSQDFLPLADALGWQLIGDVLKIGSWLMALTMVSHARTRIFIVTEVVFTAIFVAATLDLSSRFGLRGAAAAYALTYGLYWAAMVLVFERLANSLRPAEPATT